MSLKTKTTPQNRKLPANRNPPPDIPDAIAYLIGKIRTDEFVDGVDQLLRDNLENFGKAISLLRIENYGLKEATVNNERGNIRTKAQLEEKHAILETYIRENIIRVERLIGELVPRITDESRESLVDELSNKTKEDNDKLVKEININSEKIMTSRFGDAYY
ncbi:hypothetical protein AVEN_177129-1 [Araneus ventricosus]|uniref:Uncharacterized protein n=1 Tax=Araneus ventricosus TaxID=182803 RepID=A0A4Y2HLG6_ARAVE|nr:hypothetical protein AVEN_177129-1 [Araneus ventricosus]